MRYQFSVLLRAAVLVLLVAGVAPAQIFAPEGLNMPGSYNGFTNPPTVAAIGGVQTPGGTLLPNTQLPTARYSTTIYVNSVGGDLVGGTYNWLFTSGPSGNYFANKWASVNVVMDSLQSYTFNSGPDNSITLTNGKYYTMNWRNAGYTGTEAIFMETSALPVSITGVNQTPLPGAVTPLTPVTVTITNGAPESPEEKFYVRYSTDGWSTSSLLPVTVASQSGSVIIPVQPAGTSVQYYAFSSTKTNPASDFDMVTLRAENNGGANYAYTVPAPTYTITASAGPGGTIIPSGAVAIGAGADTTFTIVANVGFVIDDVLVNGVSVGAVGVYAFTNVNASQTIAASFAQKNNVTFRVNMKAKLADGTFRPDSGDVVTVRGAFNDWGNSTNNPDTLTDGDNDSVYVKTLFLNSSTNYEYKFWKSLRGGLAWEDGVSPNRAVLVGTADTVLAAPYFNNDGPPVNVTFQVNMSVQMQEGKFLPDSGDVVKVRGNFNGWGESAAFDDLNADSIYTATLVLPSDKNLEYKFYKTPRGGLDWENSIGNRQFFVPLETPSVIPSDFFDADSVAGPAAFAAASPFTLGSIPVGSSVTESLAVGNPGSIPLQITAVTLTGSPAFTLLTIPPVTVPASGEGLFVFTYTAPAAGADTALAVFESTSPSSPDTVVLTGEGFVTPKFLTLAPETLVYKDPAKPGKLAKAVKRGKGLFPNWVNLRDEVIAQGGFAPGTSESDSAGGIVIGLSYMERKNADPAKPNWKPVKDSAASQGWIRIGKWNFKKSVGASPTAIPKTLEAKTFTHTGPARGLDSTGNPGDVKRKAFVKEQKKLDPKKSSNRLFAELLTLKFNIAASALGKTPAGLGQLVVNRPGNPSDGRDIEGVAALADSMMGLWRNYTQSEFDSVYGAIRDINRAFLGPVDTLTWESPVLPDYPQGKLTLKGSVEVGSVPFLSLPLPFVAKRIQPAGTLLEPDEEFGEEDLEDTKGGVPVAAKLYQNYPNPFNPATTISFSLLEESRVTVRIFDLLGREVATLLAGEEMEEGRQDLVFEAGLLSSGVYFYRIDAEGLGDAGLRTVVTNKMMLLK